MSIFLTGGSGDVGTLLSQSLLARARRVVSLDLAPPKIGGTQHIHGSILDIDALAKNMQGCDTVVHIAAWHGIHENNNAKTPRDFHDLNVTGTFNVLQAMADSGIQKCVFISSTSIEDRFGVYGHTKILNEEMCRAYAHRHDMQIIILRPRAFIPAWNRSVYPDFPAWAAWFMKGAVHITDVNAAILATLDMLDSAAALPDKAPAYIIDGAYDYSADDLAQWDAGGAGSTFEKYYPAFKTLAATHGLDIARKPRVLDIPEAQKLPGYAPRYSLRHLLEELKEYGAEGPKPPYL